uniref:Uncharacterized protein n=1 Tax=Anguilla anguilla TaxID=7936 RepID=A0A0E9W6A3_ANGAN
MLMTYVQFCAKRRCRMTKAAFPPQELYPGTRNLLRNSVRFHRRN